MLPFFLNFFLIVNTYIIKKFLTWAQRFLSSLASSFPWKSTTFFFSPSLTSQWWVRNKIHGRIMSREGSVDKVAFGAGIMGNSSMSTGSGSLFQRVFSEERAYWKVERRQKLEENNSRFISKVVFPLIISKCLWMQVSGTAGLLALNFASTKHRKKRSGCECPKWPFFRILKLYEELKKIDWNIIKIKGIF